jgi:hypothetical protein
VPVPWSQRLRELEEKKLLKWLWWHIGLFSAVFLLLGYLGGDHDYISYRTYVTILIASAIPGILILLLMYFRADRSTRAAYRVRALLVFGFFALKLLWDYFK